MVRFLADHLLLAHSRAACLRPLSRVELAIAQVKTCSDFRLASVEILIIAPDIHPGVVNQHVVASVALLEVPDTSIALSGHCGHAIKRPA